MGDVTIMHLNGFDHEITKILCWLKSSQALVDNAHNSLVND